MKKYVNEICSLRYGCLFTFYDKIKSKQTAISQGVSSVHKFHLHIFSSHYVPKIWGSFISRGDKKIKIDEAEN